MDITSTTKGLLPPRMDSTARNAIYKLRDFLNSYYTINNGAEPYAKTTNELNALIDQYNTMMAGRLNPKEDTPPPPPPTT